MIELLYNVQTRSYACNEQVYSVGDTDEQIYFVKNGKFELKYRLIKNSDDTCIDKRITKLRKTEKTLLKDYQDISVLLIGKQEITGTIEHYLG